MSTEEEKRCPLCAEEMDWTDQQFKPCKCGYQVCVWCWHHIMDMAEKDETEGRCPACRNVYEKEKIVALQTNCERVAANSSNKKNKPPKAKPKVNEIQKDLSNVRVIQRRMAYVIGLPLSLADEDVLQRKDFFGQYGKVTKISLSRTAGGTLQQFINDTCSVYVTFSKEEEAIRCIQSVHGFVLDGRYLRASFGTAKYCHAWLRNMPCNNPGCLYLHSLGAEEDSFGKDEVAAVHTRNRVHQIAGEANNMMTRSGIVLPPPSDEYTNTTPTDYTEKPAIKSSNTKNLDLGHGSVNVVQSKSKDVAPNKTTTFVDIVGRGTENEGILDICSELSSVTLEKDTHFKAPSSPDHLIWDEDEDEDEDEEEEEDKEEPKDITDEPFREEEEDVQGSSSEQSVYDVVNPEDSSIQEEVVNSLVLDDVSHERKFQTSVKSDRIYRGSNSFSSEEIVEHLRRISDDNLMMTNDDENSALNVVESSIISNIMSMDFDSYNEDSSKRLPHNLKDINSSSHHQHHHHGVSWNSKNSDQTGYHSFVKQDAYPSQMSHLESSYSNGAQVLSRPSLFQDFRETKDQYSSYKPPSQFQVPSKSQSVYPPGFSVPCRDPPPGFTIGDRTATGAGRFSRVSSGSHLGNPLSTELIDPAILSLGGETKTGNGLSMFEDEGRLWRPMQQQQQTKFPPSNQELRYSGSSSSLGVDKMYGGYSLSSPSLHQQRQIYQQQPSTTLTQPKFGNGNGNGQILNGEAQQLRNEVGGSTVIQRNERLGGGGGGGGFNNYFPGVQIAHLW